MKAIRKKPGCEPEIIEVENTLKALQTEVGGYIETVTIASDVVVICNEEGVPCGLPYNCRFVGVDFVGFSADGNYPEVFEIPAHPFYIGTIYHPEFLSRPNKAHPLFAAFIGAAAAHQA